MNNINIIFIKFIEQSLAAFKVNWMLQACHDEIKDITMIRKCKCKNFVTGLLVHSVLKSTQMAASLTGGGNIKFSFHRSVLHDHYKGSVKMSLLTSTLLFLPSQDDLEVML